MSEIDGIVIEQLQSFVERVENLESEKENITTDIKEVYSEAKGSGFDVKTMKTIIKLRKMEASDRDEMEHMLDTYKRALSL